MRQECEVSIAVEIIAILFCESNGRPSQSHGRAQTGLYNWASDEH